MTPLKTRNVTYTGRYAQCSGTDHYPHWHICLLHIPARHQSKQKPTFPPATKRQISSGGLQSKISKTTTFCLVDNRDKRKFRKCPQRAFTPFEQVSVRSVLLLFSN